MEKESEARRRIGFDDGDLNKAVTDVHEEYASVKALKDFGVDERERQLVDSNVVPDGVAQNLEAHSPSLGPGRRQPFGPAFFVAASTFPIFSKFSRNMPASFLACAS